MTTDADRIEELAGWFEIQPEAKWLNEQAILLRSLSVELTELRRAKESLDYLITELLNPQNLAIQSYVSSLLFSSDMPLYLKSRLEGKQPAQKESRRLV